jgi:SAM-dependent methyltransferase
VTAAGVALLRRWIRRHQRLRRIAGAIVAGVSGLRVRHLTTRQRWNRAIPYEANFWADWLATQAFGDVEEYRRRIDPSALLEDPLLADQITQLPGKTISILDVGAGPLTNVGKTYPGRDLRITAVDALASDYDRILDTAGVTPPVRTELCHGEQLLERFAPATFDIAFAANALDHSYDPVLVIRNMLQVVKPGGFVVLAHRRNEAESKHYLGLHQWNFEEREGRFVIWNREDVHDVTALLDDEARVDCRDRSSNVECVIRKRAGG